MDKNLIKLSKFICLILRHKPETINIQLDNKGYANVDELINGINKKGYFSFSVDFDILKHIVKSDDKQRYSFNKDFTKIRANQGHSLPVNVDLNEAKPPDILYHGTAKKHIDNILKEGIVSKNRLYVHLSKDYETAINVGKRHGEPIVLEIDTKRMYENGYKFYLSKK